MSNDFIVKHGFEVYTPSEMLLVEVEDLPVDLATKFVQNKYPDATVVYFGETNNTDPL
ncbi:hypothetical protein UFOVP129_88 [uncultured Caudovirales phage]|uniref:Uncharacterized protein n=1 Tax=uncultured Caudovirales phage TaxID=2100421 RepID=A0A6J5L9Y3_9CAUD|nr:hypothetical protein UFOVP129_88 [uncultured Caudovirales phage]